jgi:hypothetical protein
MTISNLIEVLYALKSANGDLPVYFQGTQTGLRLPIRGARISESIQNPFALLVGPLRVGSPPDFADKAHALIKPE